jgi:1-acyl-sn-glycerol-3-phosphate acyltransferase
VSDGYGPFRRALYWSSWLLGNAFFRVWFRMRVKHRPRPFPRGALVLAANHASFLDPLLLALATPRRVTYLVTSSVFYSWPFRPFMWVFGCIPVLDGTVNVDAMRRALAQLARGGVVGIFPEGGISDDGRVREGAIGVASLLRQGGAPVLTAGLVGTFEALPRHGLFPKPHRLEVRFSEQIVPGSVGAGLAPHAARRALRDRVMTAIASALPERMRPPAPAAAQPASSAPR